MTDFMQQGLARVRYSIEPNGSYAVDRTGSIGNFFDIRSMERTITFGQVMARDERVVQRFFERTKDQLGFDRPSWELASHFVGYGSAINAAASVTKTKQAQVLECILGGYSSPGAGSLVVAAGSDENTLVVTTGQGGRFSAGGIIWVQNAAGDYEPSKVKSVSTDTLELAWSLSATPSNGAVILNSLHCFPEEPSVAQTYLQILWEAAINRQHIFLLRGMQATSLSFSLTAGEMATWTAALAGAEETQDDSIATPQGGSAIAAATYDGGEPTVIRKGGLLFGPMASTTRTHVCYTSASFAPNITHAPIPCASGTQGIREMWRQRGEAPVLTFTCPIESTNAETWRAARDAGTLYQALLYGGGAGGDFRAIECGTLQILDVLEADGGNGLRGVTVTCKALEDANSTDQTTSFRRSPFRVVIA